MDSCCSVSPSVDKEVLAARKPLGCKFCLVYNWPISAEFKVLGRVCEQTTWRKTKFLFFKIVLEKITFFFFHCRKFGKYMKINIYKKQTDDLLSFNLLNAFSFLLLNCIVPVVKLFSFANFSLLGCLSLLFCQEFLLFMDESTLLDICIIGILLPKLWLVIF